MVSSLLWQKETAAAPDRIAKSDITAAIIIADEQDKTFLTALILNLKAALTVWRLIFYYLQEFTEDKAGFRPCAETGFRP
jgi:hypothetical protein